MIKRPMFKLQVILFLLLVLGFSVFPSSWFLSQSLASTSRKRLKLVLALSVVSMEISGSHESQFSNNGWTHERHQLSYCPRYELRHIANRKQHLVREMVHAWQHATERLWVHPFHNVQRQTNKHKRVGQVELLPMKHSWEGKKEFNGT